MVATLTVAGVLGVVVLGAVLWYRHGTGDGDRHERPVLPSQYSSLLHVDRSRYPGLCTNCGTENTPGYNFCSECGETLTGGTNGSPGSDVTHIFRE